MSTIHCPNCNHKIENVKIETVYRHTLDDADIGALRKIHEYVIEQGTYEVDVRRVNLNYTERSRTTQLRFHGLLAKARNKDGKQKPSTWILTRRAAQFLKGEISIPSIVVTQGNAVKDHAGRYLCHRDFKVLKDFGPHWEYSVVDYDEQTVIVRPMKQMILIP